MESPQHHFYAIAHIFEGVLNLILSLILICYYGIYVAMGTALEMTFLKLLIQPIFTCRAIGLSIYRYYVEILLFTALKALVPRLASFTLSYVILLWTIEALPWLV